MSGLLVDDVRIDDDEGVWETFKVTGWEGFRSAISGYGVGRGLAFPSDVVRLTELVALTLLLFALEIGKK